MQIIHAIILHKDSKIASGENNDCTVTALASSFEVPYDEAHQLAKELYNRPPRKGPTASSVINAMVKLHTNGTKINGKTVDKIYVTPTKEYKCKGRTVLRKTRVKSFIKDNPKGTFFILGSRHAMTIQDGVMIDNYRKGSGGMIIRRAYLIK